MKRVCVLTICLSLIMPLCLSAQEAKRVRPPKMQKGNLHINISIPHITQVTQFAVKDAKADVGIGVISIGGDYCYTGKKHISVQAGFANASPPWEVTGDANGWVHDNELLSVFANIRNNHSVGKFDFGYGLSLTSLRYDAIDYNVNTNQDTSKYYHNTAIGGCFSIYLNTTRSFNIGLLYQPQLISIDSKPILNYQHTLSLDVLFRIGVWRKPGVQKKADVLPSALPE